MADYTEGFEGRYRLLTRHGLLPDEADMLARAYRTFEPDLGSREKHSDPSIYIVRMMKSRIQTIINLRRYGYEDEQIEAYIINRYRKNDWLFADGRINPFKMLDYYRQQSIDAGEYFPRARRHGSGKGRSISKGDVKAQRERARARARAKKGKSNLDDYEKRRMR